MSISETYNEDCMAVMARYPDKYFDLAVVDPPYGIRVAEMNLGAGKGVRCSKIQNRKWSIKKWDSAKPEAFYFQELFRLSKNQVIWGGNYFELPASQYFAIWDKGPSLQGRSFSECEYAWVKSGGTRIIQIPPFDSDRIHPTQKPVALYDWIFKNYAKAGDKILDTHLGSGSSRIAADRAGLEFVGCELDADYFAAQEKRFSQYKMQLKLL
jgi:site-specific DNA-methyltransferase (adenine-specific)